MFKKKVSRFLHIYVLIIQQVRYINPYRCRCILRHQFTTLRWAQPYPTIQYNDQDTHITEDTANISHTMDQTNNGHTTHARENQTSRRNSTNTTKDQPILVPTSKRIATHTREARINNRATHNREDQINNRKATNSRESQANNSLSQAIRIR